MSVFEALVFEPNSLYYNKGTSLWIVPDEPDTERLKTIMRTRQSERHNFPSSYPAFQPHVTLASFPSTFAPPTSDIRAAIDSALEHSHSGANLPIKFQSVDIGTHFYRSVYIVITPTPELLALHENVHARLGIEPKTPAYPHVSLCYIDDAAVVEREKFLEELKREGKIRYDSESKSVSLRCGEGEDWVWLREFGAREVWVAKCDGPVEGWTVLDKIPIT